MSVPDPQRDEVAIPRGRDTDVLGLKMASGSLR